MPVAAARLRTKAPGKRGRFEQDLLELPDRFRRGLEGSGFGVRFRGFVGLGCNISEVGVGFPNFGRFLQSQTRLGTAGSWRLELQLHGVFESTSEPEII